MFLIPSRQNLLPAILMSSSVALAACSSNDDNDILPGTDNGDGSQISLGAAELPLTVDSSIGPILALPGSQRTVYIRPGDEPGQITCVDSCTDTWPPVTTELENTGTIEPYTVTNRPDGTRQYVLQGYPLYRYSGDAGAGDVAGEGIDDEWYVLRQPPTDSGNTTLGETLVVVGSVITAEGDPAVRVDVEGHTLYTFANDSAGVSNCNDQCATTWPPLLADRGAVGYGQLYSVITRNDGTRQWAYGDKPLYLYAGDSAAGDVLGDGVDGVWSAVIAE